MHYFNLGLPVVQLQKDWEKLILRNQTESSNRRRKEREESKNENK